MHAIMPFSHSKSPSASITFKFNIISLLALCLSTTFASPLPEPPTTAANALPEREFITAIDSSVITTTVSDIVDSPTTGIDRIYFHPTLDSAFEDPHFKKRVVRSPTLGLSPPFDQAPVPPSQRASGSPMPGVVPTPDSRPESAVLSTRETASPNGKVIEKTVKCHHDMPLISELFYHEYFKHNHPNNAVEKTWGQSVKNLEIPLGSQLAKGIYNVNDARDAAILPVDVFFFMLLNDNPGGSSASAGTSRPFALEYEEADRILERACGSRVMGSVAFGVVGKGGGYELRARYGRYQLVRKRKGDDHINYPFFNETYTVAK